MALTSLWENVRPEVHQYREQYFAKSSSEPTIAKLYGDSGFQVWKV